MPRARPRRYRSCRSRNSASASHATRGTQYGWEVRLNFGVRPHGGEPEASFRGSIARQTAPNPPMAPVLTHVNGMSQMAYWTAVQLQPQRDRLALHWLGLYGFETYAPRLRDRRISRGAKVIRMPLLFPGYAFVLVQLQWSKARFSPGVNRVVMDGATPAVVPDAVIASLKAREVGGLIELPPPPPRFRRGDYVRVRQGPFANRVGLFAGMQPKDRLAVLVSLLGGSRRVVLPDAAVERWP